MQASTDIDDSVPVTSDMKEIRRPAGRLQLKTLQLSTFDGGVEDFMDTCWAGYRTTHLKAGLFTLGRAAAKCWRIRLPVI